MKNTIKAIVDKFLAGKPDQFRFTDDTVIGEISEGGLKYSDSLHQEFTTLVAEEYTVTKGKHSSFEAYGAVGNLYHARKITK